MPLLGGLRRNSSDVFKLSDDEEEGVSIPHSFDAIHEKSRLKKCLSISPSVNSPHLTSFMHGPVDEKSVPRRLRQPKTVDIHEKHPVDANYESRVSLTVRKFKIFF